MDDTAVDKSWFESYSQYGFDDIDYLNFDQAHLSKQKEKFFKNELDNLDLEYNINLSILEKYKTGLLGLQAEIESSQSSQPVVKKAYLLKLTEQLNKINLLEAVSKKDDSLVRFYSSQIYGVPNKELMRRAVSAILYVAEYKQFPLSPIWQDLAEYFGAKSDGTDISYFDGANNQDFLNTQQLVALFEKALSEKNIPWQVSVSSSHLAVALSYKDWTVYIPQGRQVTVTEAKALIEHEINVHLQRHINGLNSRLLLLSSGLNAYLSGEEGLATYKQVLVDKNNIPGLTNYLSVGLLSGLHRGRAWNFQQLFALIEEYLLLSGLAADKVSETAWKRTLRAFRGSTGQLSGNVYTRGIIYFGGYLNIKNLVERGDSETERLFVGKYDPLNSDHIDILNILEIK